MATIKIKNSQVKDKAPQPSDLVDGELAINTHADSPAVYLKDTAGAVRKIAGVGAVGATAATDTAAGVVELATAAEVTTGTDTTRAVTPAGLKVELDKKAPLASPALTGTPTAPTAAAGTNTTQLATTAFVTTAVAAENLWDRSGTVISPTNAGDSLSVSNATLQRVNLQSGLGANNWILAGYPDALPSTNPTFIVDKNGHLTLGSASVSLDPGTTGSPLVRDSQGRVGIGTAPSSKFHINLGTDENIHFFSLGGGDQRISTLDDAAASNVQLSLQADPLLFRGAGGREVGRWDSSGRLLVGTSSARVNVNGYQPLFQVETAGAADAPNRYASFTYGRDNSGGSFGLAFNRHASTTVGGQAVVADTYVLGQLDFNGSDGTNFIPGARIQAVVDGTPGANDMPGRLMFFTTAHGASSPTQRMAIMSDGAVSFTNGSVVINSSAIVSGAGTNALKWDSNTGTVTYDTSSRLIKENIIDCPYGIDALKQLQPRKYFRADDKREEIGFVADEVVSVLPELVPIGPKSVITRNEDDTEKIPLGVNYDRLTAVLTKALQEAVARIETLEAKVAALTPDAGSPEQ